MGSKLKAKIEYLFKDGFFHIIGGNTLSKAISFISTIAIVRIISKSDYGYLVYADNLYSYVIILSGLGMSSAILVYCSKGKEVDKENGYFIFALRNGILIQVFGSICILLYYLFLTDIFRDAMYIVLALALYPTGAYIVSAILAFVRSHFENRLFIKLSLIQTVCIFLLSISLAFVLGSIGIAAARYVGIIVLIVLSLKFFRDKNVKMLDVKLLSLNEKKKFISTSVSLLIMNMFSQLMVSNETLLINMLVRNEEMTANYKVAILIPSQLIFITSSIAMYFFPKVSKMGLGKQLWEYSKRVGICTFALIVIIIMVAVPATPFVIGIIFGRQYLDVGGLLNLFWIAYGLNASIRMIPLNILPAVGKEKFNAVLSIVSCIVHFCVDYVCIKNYGIHGAAIASIIVYSFSGIIAWIYLRYSCRTAS